MKVDPKALVTQETLDRTTRKLTEDLNKIIHTFQQSSIEGQTRLNLVWNVMNVFIRVLSNKGLVTEEEMKEVGAVLMVEMKEAMNAMKDGQRPNPTPMEVAKKAIFQS